MNSSRHNGSTNKYLNLINIPTVSLHIASRIGSPPVRPRTTSGEPEFPSETDDRGAAPSSDIEDSVEDAASCRVGVGCYLERVGI